MLRTTILPRIGRVAIASLCLSWSCAASTAQEEVIVTATRVEKNIARVPMAVSAVNRDAIQQQQQIALDEALGRVPGVFFQDRYNFAQDLRISVRGFGARANFGTRGVKIFVDGIPGTVTDGQGQLDDIDLGSADRIEVIRGPASALYGSSAGGVINIHTEDGPEQAFVAARISLGEYDFGKYQIKTGGQLGALNYIVSGSYLGFDGYRRHTAVEQYLVNSKFRYTFADGATLQWVINAVDSPLADDPGGLSPALISADRRQAWRNNLSFDAGEAFNQQKFGWVYERDFGQHHHLSARNYVLWRDFSGKLGFGGDAIVEFERFFVGGGVQYSYDAPLLGHQNRFTIGVDIESQEDDRQRFINQRGLKGPLVFDQTEQADAIGVFFQNEFAVTETIDFVLGGRYDMIDLEVDDLFLSNADQSTKLEFDEFNPMVGVVYHPAPALSIYANYATAFETPTFTELGRPARNARTGPPVSLGGFDNVSPQTTDSYEIGVRGILWDRVRYDAAVFYMETEDEITNVTTTGTRGEFHNADTERTGAEAALVINVFQGLDLSVAYSYADFEFDRFDSNPAAEGGRLPGHPEHQFFAELAYQHPNGFFAKWNMQHVGRFYANNNNTVENDAYEVASVYLGYAIDYAHGQITPFFGINNLFNEDYNQNVVLNAFGGRNFEPAPERNVYGGLSVRYNFGR